MTMQRTIVMGFRILLLMMNSGLVMTDVIAMNFLSKQQFDGDHNKKNRLYIHIEERLKDYNISLGSSLN